MTPFEEEFYNYEIHSVRSTYEKEDLPLNGLYIGLNFDAIEEVRTVYTFWDVLGDIGGLIDMLVLLGQPLIYLLNLIMGTGIRKFLTESLFMK